ncbi:MAG: hypothetical protein ABIL51_07380 [candidate division WOR-3 bacterium]
MILLFAKFTFNAGSMKILFSGETIYILSNGVYITTDEYEIKGSYGKYYENSGKVFLNDASVKSSNLSLFAKSLFYNKYNKFLELKGNAYFEDNYRRISGDIIKSKGDSAWVFGNVDVLSKNRNLRVYGDSAFYDGKNAYGWVRGKSMAVIPSSDTLNIFASMFLLHRDTTFGYGDVVIKSASAEAKGDTFVADVRGDTLRKVFLFGNVSIAWKNGKGYSKIAEMVFEGGELRNLVLRDSARVIYNEGGGTIEVEGGIIRAKVERDSLKHIRVEKLERGVYR